jgi:hypothetical protein
MLTPSWRLTLIYWFSADGGGPAVQDDATTKDGAMRGPYRERVTRRSVK